MSKRLTVKAQFLLACGLFLAVVAGLGISSWWCERELTGLLSHVIGETARKSEMAAAMGANFQEMRAESRGAQISVLVNYFESQSKQGGECSACHTSETVTEHRTRFKALASQVNEKLDGMGRIGMTELEQQQASQVRRSLHDWTASYDEYLGKAAKGDFDAAHTIATDRIAPSIEQSGLAAVALVQAQRVAMTAARSEAEDRIRKAGMFTIGFTCMGVLTALAVAWLLWRLAGTLRESAVEMSDGAVSLQSAAEQISQASESVAEGASRQAQVLRETSSGAEQMRATTHASLAGLTATSAAGKLVDQRVADAGKALSQTLEAMSAMNAGAEKISKIIKTIDEIAFQTNLLALNAAVEAARAGEAGLGFAVVAEEVRTLARRCAEASNETGSLVTNAIQATRHGREKLDTLASAVGMIAAEVATMLRHVDEVKRGGEQQAIEIDRAASSFLEISRTTQQTSSAAEESASAATELNTQAEHLALSARAIQESIGD